MLISMHQSGLLNHENIMQHTKERTRITCKQSVKETHRLRLLFKLVKMSMHTVKDELFKDSLSIVVQLDIAACNVHYNKKCL